MSVESMNSDDWQLIAEYSSFHNYSFYIYFKYGIKNNFIFKYIFSHLFSFVSVFFSFLLFVPPASSSDTQACPHSKCCSEDAVSEKILEWDVAFLF